MGFGLFLLDCETTTINKLDQKKRLRLDKLDKVFFDLQVVPLFGDMQIAPFNYVKSSKNFDPSRWPLSSSSAVSPQVQPVHIVCVLIFCYVIIFLLKLNLDVRRTHRYHLSTLLFYL